MFQPCNLKEIPGYEGLYAVSQDGYIWSFPKRVNKFNGSWLKFQVFENKKRRLKLRKYYTVTLSKNNKEKRFQVHRLVALTYIQNYEDKPQINHKDGNPLNNNVSNLEWSTNAENMRHAVKTGLFDIHSGDQDRTRSSNGKKTGALNGMKSRRMFSIVEANCIRKIHETTKRSYLAISRVYNCSGKTISNICNHKSYLLEVSL